MRKSLLIICSFAAVGIVLTFTIGRNRTSNGRHLHPNAATSARQSAEIPDHVRYDFLFRNVVRLRQKTNELQAQGQLSHKPYFPLKKPIGLTDDEAAILESIAFAARHEVGQQDEKAKAIIAAFQSQFPGGRVPEGGSPPPPPELKSMWKEREAIILRARDQIRAAIGEKEFARVDKYAKTHFVATTKE